MNACSFYPADPLVVDQMVARPREVPSSQTRRQFAVRDLEGGCRLDRAVKSFHPALESWTRYHRPYPGMDHLQQISKFVLRVEVSAESLEPLGTIEGRTRVGKVLSELPDVQVREVNGRTTMLGVHAQQFAYVDEFVVRRVCRH